MRLPRVSGYYWAGHHIPSDPEMELFAVVEDRRPVLHQRGELVCVSQGELRRSALMLSAMSLYLHLSVSPLLQAQEPAEDHWKKTGRDQRGRGEKRVVRSSSLFAICTSLPK